MISWKISLKIKRSRRISISTMSLKKIKVEINKLWVHYQQFGLQLSQPDYSRRIQWRLTQKKFNSLQKKLCCSWDKHQIPFPTTKFCKTPEGVSEGNTNKRFFSWKERRPSIRKNNTVITKNSYEYRYGKYKPRNPVQQSGISLCSSSRGFKHIHPYIKCLFCVRNIPNMSAGRKVKKFYKQLENFDKRFRNYFVSGGLCNTISQTSLTRNIPTYPKLSQEQKILVPKEIHEMLNEGTIAETPNNLEGEFISNLFLVEKNQ